MLFFKEISKEEKGILKEASKKAPIYTVRFFAVWSLPDWSYIGRGGGNYYSFLTASLQEAEEVQKRWISTIEEGYKNLQGRNFSSPAIPHLTVLNISRNVSEELVGKYSGPPNDPDINMYTYDPDKANHPLYIWMTDFIGDFITDCQEEEKDLYQFKIGQVLMPKKDAWAHPIPVGESGKVLDLATKGDGMFHNLWMVEDYKYFSEFKIWCVSLKNGEGWYPAMKFCPATAHYLR